MVIERSRQWVKDRMPAFICRETSWWVSRWIQTNIFLCPHCRAEYRSLKKVWDHLDAWDCEEPSVQCETVFSSKFREQFPSAFTQDSPAEKRRLFESGYGKVAFAGGVLGVALVSLMVIRSDFGGLDPSPEVQVAESSIAPVERQIDEPTLHASASSNPQPNIEATNPNSIVQNETDLIPSSERSVTYNPPVLTVSMGNYPSGSDWSQAGVRPMSRHTVEINNHPVTGFTALSFSTEEQAY